MKNDDLYTHQGFDTPPVREAVSETVSDIGSNELLVEYITEVNSDDPEIQKSGKEHIVGLFHPTINNFLKKRFYQFKQYWDDMYQSAVMTVLEVAQSGVYVLDKNGGVSYFSKYILHSMYEYITYYVTGTTTHYYKVERVIASSVSKLEDDGEAVSYENILKVSGLSEYTLRNAMLMKNIHTPLSLDQLYENGSDGKETADIDDPASYDQESVEERIFTEVLHDDLTHALSILPTDERFAVCSFYGFHSTKLTHREISAHLGLTVGKERYLIYKALARLAKDVRIKGYMV